MLQLETTIIYRDCFLYQKELLQHLQRLLLRVVVLGQLLPIVAQTLVGTILLLLVTQRVLDGITQQDLLLLRSYEKCINYTQHLLVCKK